MKEMQQNQILNSISLSIVTTIISDRTFIVPSIRPGMIPVVSQTSIHEYWPARTHGYTHIIGPPTEQCEYCS